MLFFIHRRVHLAVKSAQVLERSGGVGWKLLAAVYPCMEKRKQTNLVDLETRKFISVCCVSRVLVVILGHGEDLECYIIRRY